MKLRTRYSDILLNLLVAVAVSLVVNFSYLLLLLVCLGYTSPSPRDKRQSRMPYSA